MQDTTTLICLFHHEDKAHAALEDLTAAGIAPSSVTLLKDDGPANQSPAAKIEALGVPARDQQHFLDALRDGAVIVGVSALTEHGEIVEQIFQKHSASKTDERDRDSIAAAPVAVPSSSRAQGLGDVRTLRLYRATVLDDGAKR